MSFLLAWQECIGECLRVECMLNFSEIAFMILECST
jgi:hypothetical protein